MILVLETNRLFNLYNKGVDYSSDALKELRSFLKSADENSLKEIASVEFATWKELTDKMNSDRDSFPGSFFMKEFK